MSVIETRTQCCHGTYIGRPGGVDYMCQHCEDGVTQKEYEEYKSNALRARLASNALFRHISLARTAEDVHLFSSEVEEMTTDELLEDDYIAVVRLDFIGRRVHMPVYLDYDRSLDCLIRAVVRKYPDVLSGKFIDLPFGASVYNGKAFNGDAIEFIRNRIGD